ncbi:hypothetical protein BX666DRAFT_2006530 [Dichotomocladium elegans]|nr:hypothetical protein BX666DRAFT_2006530 [Dichotomocladium elegans]
MVLTDVNVEKSNPHQLDDDNSIDTTIDAVTALEERPVTDVYPFTIVTAASANHLCALENMLYNLHNLKQHVAVEDFPRIVVYDLGITDQQKTILDSLKNAEFFDELVVFDYEKYPSFWNISIARGEYAWKTGIVKETQELYGGVIVWLDTGDVPNALFMRMIPKYIRRHGFWSPRSTGFVGSKFNHEGAFEYFKMSRKEYGALENCNGAALGFDADNKLVVDALITPWYECGLDKDCIAPPGSSRSNHRQDQSAITLLAVKAGYRCFEYPEFHGITIHQDEACQKRLESLEEKGSLLHPSFIDL